MFGVSVIILWVIAGILTLGEAIKSNTNRVYLPNYIICWAMLIFELFCDYILKI